MSIVVLAVSTRGVNVTVVIVNNVPRANVPGRAARRRRIACGPNATRLDDAAVRDEIVLECA